MDITKVELGEVIEGFKCPKCKSSEIQKTGIKHNDNKSLMTCYNCFYEEWTDTKDANFTYEPLKELKKKKEKRKSEE